MTEIPREATLKAARKNYHLAKEDHHSNFRSPLLCNPKSQETVSATHHIEHYPQKS